MVGLYIEHEPASPRNLSHRANHPPKLGIMLPVGILLPGGGLTSDKDRTDNFLRGLPATRLVRRVLPSVATSRRVWSSRGRVDERER